MKIIKESDPNYPKNLIGLKGSPKLLYLNGKLLKKDRFAVAIVGTRDVTKYGREIASEFSYELAKNDLTIVSGMARGIDTIAHKSALKAGGRTIAVLGSGLDVIYPPENRNLYNEIVEHGAVVSEFKPGTMPYGKHFLARNRIISGISLAILVVEGKERSGTLSTATHAAVQGREVFAIPGPINSPQSYAPNYLIENGARVAKTPQDIVEYIRQVKL